MKEIKISNNEKSDMAIAEAISLAEGKATKRGINIHTVKSICNDVEKKLNISKKAMEGVVARYRNTFAKPNAYRYKAYSTQFTVIYRHGYWYVTDISRNVAIDRKWDIVITLSETAKAAILKKYEGM